MFASQKRFSNTFYTAIFSIAYFVSYVTRLNYAAVISEMAASENMSKSALSLALTGLFITYGIGQLVSGVLGDRFQPKNVLLSGLLISTAMNFLLPLCSSSAAMTAVWCVNGFAQALIWPPLVRLMTNLFDAEYYKKACMFVTVGGNFGTMMVYILAPTIINNFTWRGVFYIAALCGLVMSIVWFFTGCYIDRPEKSVRTVSENSESVWKYILTPAMILIFISIILQGSLRDGVTTWMPSYISENFKMSTTSAIFSGVLLPIFSIIMTNVTSFVYRKLVRNPLACAALFFALGAVSAFLLQLVRESSPGLSVVLLSLLCASMHGVNYILICMIPAYFNGTGKVSTISGIVNAFTYIGSALSTYGIAKIAEVFGWGATITVWIVSASLGTILCALIIRHWRKKYM